MFITLEGGEGSGKSTIAKFLSVDLSEFNDNVLITREPGSSRLGQHVRELILNDENIHLTDKVEALLFAADRAQHVEEKIRPILNAGGIVICDRYVDSSVAYQGYGRGLKPEDVAYLSMWATENLTPDLTFFINTKPEIGLTRKTVQEETNKMENEELEFHYKVYEGFYQLAQQHPERIHIIDGEQTLDKVYADILTIIKNRF